MCGPLTAHERGDTALRSRSLIMPVGGCPEIGHLSRHHAPNSLMDIRARLRPLVNTLRERPVRSSQLAVIVHDLATSAPARSRLAAEAARTQRASGNSHAHLEATIEWLCRAQDVGDDRGVSTAYSFRSGWGASYPETTGYIVPTFFDYAAFTDQPNYSDRALEMGEWLLSIQMTEGAFQAGPRDQPPRPSVFNTGQILLGLVRLYKETRDDRYLKSIVGAADWLVTVQDPDGAWSHFAYHGIAHTYYVRVAWALLEAYAISNRKGYRESAVKQLDWALGNQTDSGWFTHNSFDGNSEPFTHTIMYAAEGLFRAGLVLGDHRYLDSAIKVASALQARFDAYNFLPGQLDASWSGSSRYSCLTGDAQLAGLLLALYERTADKRYVDTAVGINHYVKSTQRLGSDNPGICGGVKGSDPIWGRYMTYSYPNWAAKFLADSLMREDRILSRQGET
jgi:hypothetical protein